MMSNWLGRCRCALRRLHGRCNVARRVRSIQERAGGLGGRRRPFGGSQPAPPGPHVCAHTAVSCQWPVWYLQARTDPPPCNHLRLYAIFQRLYRASCRSSEDDDNSDQSGPPNADMHDVSPTSNPLSDDMSYAEEDISGPLDPDASDGTKPDGYTPARDALDALGALRVSQGL